MSIFKTIKNLVSAGFGNGQNDEKLYIVDGSHLDEHRRNHLTPTEKIDILQRLGRFAKKEKVQIHTIFEGNPLRVVEDGGDFSDIKVYFTKDQASLDELILKQYKKHASRREVMVITADKKLEEAVIDIGGHIMRASTFRKALDSAGSGRRASSTRVKSQNHKNNNRSNGSKKKKPEDEENRVSELIDLVE